MEWKNLDRRARLNCMGVLVLVIGLGLAVTVDLTARDEQGPVLGYDMSDGAPRPVNPEDSKQYLRALEQYNGKMGVFMYEIRTWFDGLWRGKGLAKTLYVLTAGAAVGIFAYARRQPPDSR